MFTIGFCIFLYCSLFIFVICLSVLFEVKRKKLSESHEDYLKKYFMEDKNNETEEKYLLQ
jgi:hypothetical protein